MSSHTTWWDYVTDAVTKSGHDSFHLLPIAITSQAEGAIPSEGWATGQGKSTLACSIAKLIYKEFYGYTAEIAEEEIKRILMGNWNDYHRVMKRALTEGRLPVIIADDFDEWAGKHLSHNKGIQWTAKDFLKKRPYIGVLLAPMSHLGNMSAAWRGVWMFEIKVYALGKYEVQYIKTKTKFGDPEKPYKLLDKNTIKPLKGKFPKMSTKFQKWYDEWRNKQNELGFNEGWAKYFKEDGEPKTLSDDLTSIHRFTKMMRDSGFKGSDVKMRELYNAHIKPMVDLLG